MRKLSIFIILFFCLLTVRAQQVSLQDVANRTYRAEGIRGIKPMLDGEHYTQMSADGKKIIQYSFKTGKETGTIFDVNTARDCSIKSFDDYIMSPDEKLILIQTETKPIYRRSFTANYYIFNVKNNKMEPLSENGPQQVPLFSPDGNQIAFVRDNNIYLVKLLFGNSASQVTKDGKFNEVLNGIPDWVYEEEFGFNRAFDFSADSQMLAYIRFDESQVPMYSFPLYKGMVPALEKFSTYPGEYEYKYPMPGIDNSKVTVHTFDIKSKVTRKMDLPLDADSYIPRIKFTDDENALAIMTLNRHQNRFDLYFANPRSTLCKLMVRDEAPQYIKEEAYSNIVFYPKNFVVMSEKDGYNHLYLYTSGGNLVKQITKGNFEVKDFLGWDEATNTFYFESNEGSPLRTAIYKVDGKGKKTKLSKQEGTHKAIFSNNMKYYINTYSNINTPPVITLNDNNGKELLKCVNQYIEQWNLEEGFKKYVNEECTFCGSLVDRIVPGRIRDPQEVARLEEENHYADPLTDVGEVFGLWVIEGDEKLNDVLPFKKAGLIDKVFVTPDMSPYKKRKVRILNGAHTGFVLGAYLAGQNIVRDCMHDEVIKGFMNKMLYDEVIPTLTLDKNDLLNFAQAVSDRFNNPFVDHELMSISLNSTSKWKERVMPSFLGYIDKHHALPKCITTSFAFYIQFYRGYELTDAGLVAKRPAGNTYTISDDRDILEFYYNHKDDSVKDLVHAVCTNTSFWGQDLTQIAGFEDAVVQTLTEIEEKGTYEVMKECL